ncbi:MAG: peptidylprolyl isomerase [Aliarcobacter sp.]|nr:peptidylprolyl isomerase [Aliarcobacter sp.]
MKKIALSLIVSAMMTFAANVLPNELSSFVAQKYKVDYNTQTQENKDKLKKEYEDTLRLVNLISNDVKNDIDYKAAKNLIAINVWSQKYMQNLKINDEVLKELYNKEKPKTVPTYNLYNIFMTDKKKAENLFYSIEKLPKTERLNEFKKQVKINSQDFISNKKDGNIGWIEIQKLDKDIQERIKDKNTNDILIAPLENIGWQILIIADYKPVKEVSFEESKEFLTKLAKQQELIRKVDSLLK